MLLKDIIYKGMETVSVLYPEGEAREMVFAYMEDAFGIRKLTHILEPASSLTEQQVQKALADFGRMASGEPLQYITGKAHFYGRQFRVTPDVLIPRQETESLCCSVIDNVERLSPAACKILDLCTGSGCIAWTLALEIPGSEVTALDISDRALAVASSQDFAEELSLSGARRPEFMKADILQEPDIFPHDGSAAPNYDIIVSNPPYVTDSEKAQMRTNVLDHEPHLALFVPDDDPMKFYRAVAAWSVKYLKEEGVGIVEINEAYGLETSEVFRKAGFGCTEIIRDLHEKDRFVSFSKVPVFKKNRFF